eukprot:gene4974-6061_t
MDSLSWKDALTVVLRREGRPMHIHSIAWHCLEGGLVKSTARAPWNVVWAVLKGSTDDFVQCEEQIFTHVDAASFTHLDITAARAEAQRLKPQLDRLVDVKREGGGALGDDAPRAPEASSPPRVQEPAPLGAATPRTPSSRMSHFSVPLDEVQLETVTLDQLLELTDQLIEERSRADAADVRAAAAEQRAIEAELHLEALMKACRVLCTTSSSIEAEYRIATTSPHVPRHVPATATGGLRSAVYQAAQTSDVESLSASGIASQFRTDFQHLDAYPLSQTLFGEYGRGLHAYHPAERVAASITKTPHTPLAHRWWTDAGVGSHSLPPKVHANTSLRHPYDDQSSGVSEVPTDAQIAVETPAAAEVEVAAPSNARVTRVGQQAETLSTRTSPRSVRSPLGDREKGGSNELGARITSRGSSPEEFISRAQLASSSRAVVSGPGVGLEQGPSGMGPVVEPLYGARRPGPVEREVVQEPKAEIWKTNAASEQLEITTAVIAPPLCDAFVYIGALLRPEEADGFFKGTSCSPISPFVT